MKDTYLFIGFAVSNLVMESIQKEDKNKPIQTHKFIWNLIKSMEYKNENDFIYLSTRPVSDYPAYPKKYIKSSVMTEKVFDKEVKIYEIPFLNIGILKLFTRFITGLIWSVKLYSKKERKKGIIVYSVHVPFMLLGYLLSRFYRVEFIAIWTDPPAEVLHKDSLFKSTLRNIEFKIAKWLMRRTDKVIALTKSLAEDFAPNKRNLIIEGIINPLDINQNIKTDQTKETNLVYTGTIAKKYGIENIVKGFLEANIKNLYLDIYGVGDFDIELLNICNSNSNIRYHGFVDNKIILEKQRKASFLINARAVDEGYVKYSFPSKTLEYMASGTPLISTMLPGIPKEYKDYIIVLKDNHPNTIAKTIKEVVLYSESERNTLGESAKKFIETKDIFNQGLKITSFLNNNNGGEDY